MLAHRAVTRLVALLALCAHGALLAEPRQVSDFHWQSVDKVVAFGDVHGAFDALRDALRSADIIDASDRWTGGSTHLVSLGDLLDRGADSRKVMDLLMALQPQAVEAGGRVHVVLGNHEVMNLTGDLRYVAPGEYAAFADPQAPSVAPGAEPERPPGYANHRRGFAKDGAYGRWLLELPLLLQIDETVFVHGGLPPAVAQASIDAINQRFQEELTTLLSLGPMLSDAGLVDLNRDFLGQGRPLTEWLDNPDNAEADAQLVDAVQQFVAAATSDLFSWKSPNWYRGTAVCAEPVEWAVTAAALKKQGAKRVLMGHTPTSNRRVQQRLGGSAVLADTGMLSSYYGGQASLVSINGTSLSVWYANAGETVHQPDIIPPLGESPAAIETRLSAAPLPADPGQMLTVGPVKAVFEPGNTRTNRSKVAAYRLSELLGWGVVPVTVDRGSGVLVAHPMAPITEAQRIEANVARPNHCAVGNAYQLMYAFDALIQNEQRTAASILYDQDSWRLFLTGHGAAFTRSRSLPRYLASLPKVLPAAALKQLAALDEQALSDALAPLLSAGQIKSVLKRRDGILKDWAPEPVVQ